MAKKRKAKVGSAESLALGLAYRTACQEKKRLLKLARNPDELTDQDFVKSQIRDCERIIEYSERRIGGWHGDDVYDDFDEE